MTEAWYSGNAADDGANNRGWILGHFIEPAENLKSTKDLEVKWGVHPVGQQRLEWTVDDQRTTLVLLVEGRFRIDLTGGNVILAHRGDYVVWGPGIDHSWQAEEDSIVITVRWPSL